MYIIYNKHENKIILYLESKGGDTDTCYLFSKKLCDGKMCINYCKTIEVTENFITQLSHLIKNYVINLTNLPANELIKIKGEML